MRKPLAGRPRSRWVPAEALPQEGVPSAPIFRPTAEEFADPYAYIAQIREQASAAGIAMVVPPVGWQPPSMLRDPVTGQLRDDLKFPVRRQPTHLLCRRYATADGGPEEVGGLAHWGDRSIGDAAVLMFMQMCCGVNGALNVQLLMPCNVLLAYACAVRVLLQLQQCNRHLTLGALVTLLSCC